MPAAVPMYGPEALEMPQPAKEPAPGSPTESRGFDEEMLSPVSKLELARKYAAQEQQRRIDAACDRMVAQRKEQLTKRDAIAARLEDHIRNKPHAADDDDAAGSSVVAKPGRLASITRRLVDVFASTTNAEANTKQDEQDDVDTTYSPTRQLLRATRSKLNTLVASGEVTPDGDAEFPTTNYHLKQLGLVNDKINIYAPLDEQQRELRRRRECAIRGQERTRLEASQNVHDDYNSADDSDYADADNDSAEDDDDSDLDLDEDELRQLIQDQATLDERVARWRQLKSDKKKMITSRSSALGLSPLQKLTALVFVTLAVIMAVFVAEEQSSFCRNLLQGGAPVEDARVLTCGAVAELHAMLMRLAALAGLLAA